MAKRERKVKKVKQVGPMYRLNTASASAGKCKPRLRANVTGASKPVRIKPTPEMEAYWAEKLREVHDVVPAE